ncbi:MAG: hypothetical protein ACE5KZ_16855 [Candidatus Scalinduaceae bacterium]
MENIEGLFGGFGVIIFIIFLIILAILWLILPIAVFGIKDKLNRLIYTTKNMDDNMSLMIKELKSLNRKLGNKPNDITNDKNNKDIKKT